MNLPFSTSQLSELIGLIYDAAIDPARWSIAIEEIRTALGFENAVFALQTLPSCEILLNMTSNIPQGYAERLPSYSVDVVELWGEPAATLALPMHQPQVLSRINPEAVRFNVTTNRYVQEWGRPQGLLDVLSVVLARDNRALGSISFCRHESAGLIGERQIEAASLLIPHLQRAATINRLLDIAALARSTFEAALDTLAAPIFLTTADLRVVHANLAAHEVVARGDLLNIRNGVLAARAGAVSSALAVAVAQAARDESMIGRKGLGIPVRRQNGSVGALHVLPLRPGRISLEAGTVAAVFVAQADTPFVPPTDLVAALFGLTPAEARVFEQIVAGRTVAEAARVLDIGSSTVRTHLLRLFDKTGVRRQAGLMQLAASLAAPVALGIAPNPIGGRKGPSEQSNRLDCAPGS